MSLSLTHLAGFAALLDGGAGPAPLEIASVSYQQDASSTSHPVTLPSGSGGVLLVLVSTYIGTATISVGSGSGWSAVNATTINGNYIAAWLWKVSDGSDALTLSLSTSRVATITVLRITGATTVDGAGSSAAAVTAWNAPSLTPAPGLQPYVWLAVYFCNQSTTLVPPSGYTLYGENDSGTNNHHYIATKTETSSSDDPASATNTSSGGGLGAYTFAVG